MTRDAIRFVRGPRAPLMSICAFLIGISAGALAHGAEPAAAHDAEVTAAAAEAPTRRERARKRRDERADRAAVTTEAVAGSPLEVAAETAAQPEPVCRTMKVLGSRVAKRVCGTPEEWAASTSRGIRDSKETMRQIREQSAIAQPVGTTQRPLGP